MRSAWLCLAGAALLLGDLTSALAEGVAAAVKTIVDGTPHQALFAVALDGDQGIAVGAAGQVMLTRDGGSTWRPSKQSGATALSLLGVTQRKGLRIAVGQSGLVMVSRDGDVWQRIDPVTPERLFAVSSSDAGKIVAVGAFGTVILSADEGRSWRSIAPPDVAQYSDQGAEPHLYAVSVSNNGVVTVAGEFGLILRTQDDGAHWSLVHKGVASLFALDLPAAGPGYAVGQTGTILRSDNGGQTWVDVPSASQANLLGVSASPGGKAIVTAMDSVLVSDDTGAHWRPVNWGDFGSSWYSGVQFLDSQPTAAILVGHAGRILRMNP